LLPVDLASQHVARGTVPEQRGNGSPSDTDSHGANATTAVTVAAAATLVAL
jgi:hypothetical protein